VLLVNSDHGSPGVLFTQLLGLLRAIPSGAPAVDGPTAREAALQLFHQMQAGAVDRSRLGDEFSAYLREDRLRAAAPRLRALGEPRRVDAEPSGERGGMEVTSLRFTFADRVVRAALFRTPDGRVQQFLLHRD
jgi:D-alanyl-D-alanine carboxypeptidase